MKKIDVMFVKTPDEVSIMIIEQMKKRWKEGKFTQEQLSRRAGVSLGSLKRFETSGGISPRSLTKLATTSGCEDDPSSLFAKKQYSSIQEILDENI